MYIYICIFTDISKVKLATVVEVNPKVPFTIATTLRCQRGCYTFPWIAPLTLDPYLMMLGQWVYTYKGKIYEGYMHQKEIII